jgi:hypothetical protein
MAAFLAEMAQQRICTHSWHKTRGGPPLKWIPSPPEILHALAAPPGYHEEAEMFAHQCVPPGYVYIHTAPPNTQYFNYDAIATICNCHQDFIPDLVTNKGITTV